MKQFIYTLSVAISWLAITGSARGQGFAVSTTGSAPSASSVLDLSSTSKGVLVPRMTTAQRNAIATPATGLMIYQTDGTAGFYFYSGTSWTAVGTAAFPSGTNGQVMVMSGGVPTFINNVPTLTTTTTPNTIATTSALTGGTITSDGGTSITARGVCWSTTNSPTIGLSTKSSNGTGTGNFTSNITGLTPGTTYYVRSYASNSVGTVYGPELTFTTTAVAIGASYGGGVVAYILQVGDPGYSATMQHGLIAPPSDQSSGAAFDCSSQQLAATSTNIGSGQDNTTAIFGVCGATTAASICDALTFGGFSDWYLPSRDELNKLYVNRAAIGGFTTGFYWCSSEFASGSAWDISFNTGVAVGFAKTTNNNVRAIRSF